MVAILKHRCEAAAHDQGVVVFQVQIAQCRRMLELGHDLGCIHRAHGDQVVSAPLRWVARIGQGVDGYAAALRTGNSDVVALLAEFVVRMEQLGRPEANWPAGGGGHRWIRHDHQDTWATLGVGNVDDLAMRVGMLHGSHGTALHWSDDWPEKAAIT